MAASTPTSAPSRFGLVRGQVVEVLVRRQEHLGYGSGYQVGPHLVLTAGHVTDGASLIRVRFGCRPDPAVKVPARVVWRGAATDLALLWLDWADEASPWPTVVPVFGDLSVVSARQVAFTAVGFPAHKQRERPGGGILRDSDQVDGEIPTAANVKTALLDLHRGGRPLTLGPAWKGISGAAVFARGLLVGTVVQAEARDTPLIAEPLAVPFGKLSPTAAERQEPEERTRAFRGQLEKDGVAASLLPVRREPAYARVITEVAARCQRLEGRERELSDLAAFVGSEQRYAWWRAPPWAGKTALAARFATHAPAHVDVVAFFVSRALGQQTSQFLKHLCDQLAALLDEEPPSVADHPAFLDLWARAAEQAQVGQRRLLLLVDGLDENNTSPPIAALLPEADLPAAQVLLFGRWAPGIPHEVDQGHPLRHPRRCLQVRLEPSRQAQKLESLARRDLETYLTDQDKTPRRVLSLLAASGPLAIEEMAALLQLEGVDVDGLDIRRVVDQAAARVLERRRHGIGDRSNTWRYDFAHETLHAATVADIHMRKLIVTHEDAVRRWADQHVAAGWPDDTPQYLLDGYLEFLVQTEDTSRLAALPSPRRFRLLRARTGDDAAALEEISRAFSQLQTAPPDVRAASVLAIHRDHLLQPLENYPAEIAVGWATAGLWARAEHLARRSSHWNKIAIVTGLAEAAAVAGEQTRAVEFFNDAREAATDIARSDADREQVRMRYLARAAAAAGRWEEAEAILKQIHQIGDVAMWINALADMLRAAGAAGDKAGAARWHNLAKQGIAQFGLIQQWHLFAPLADAAASAGLWEQAEADARSAGLNQAKALTRVARIAAGAAQWEHAEAAARSIDGQRTRMTTLTMVAEAAAAAGERARAGDVFEKLDSEAQSRAPATGAVLALKARVARAAGEPIRAAALLDRAEAAAGQADHPASRAAALAEVAEAAALAGERARAAKLLAAARDAVRQISDQDRRLHGYEFLAAAAAGAGMWELGKEISRETGYPGAFDLTLLQTIGSYAALGWWDQAEAAARQVDDLDKQAAILGGVASAAAADGHRARAVTLLDAAEDVARRVQPLSISELTNDFMKGLVVRLLINTGQWEKVASVARQTTDPASSGPTLVDVAWGAAKAGQWEQAETIAGQLDDPLERARILAAMAEAAAAAGQWERAEVIAYRVEDPSWRSSALAAAARAAAEAGRWKHAQVIVSKVDDSRKKDWALTAMAEAAAAAGQWERAEVIAYRVEDPSWRSSALAAAARAAAEAGRWKHAQVIVSKVDDSRKKDRALTAMAEAAAVAGQWERANTIAHKIGDLHEQAIALAKVGKAAGAVGQSAQAALFLHAAEIPHHIDDRRQRAKTLADIAEAAAAAGCWKQAGTIAHQIDDPWWIAIALSNLARAAAGCERASAGDLLNTADHAARQLTGLRQRTTALAAVAEAAASVGERARAAALLDAGQEAARHATGLDAWEIVPRLMSAAASAGRWEQAEVIIDQLDDASVRVLMFAWLAEMALGAGASEQAHRIAAEACPADPDSEN